MNAWKAIIILVWKILFLGFDICYDDVVKFLSSDLYFLYIIY